MLQGKLMLGFSRPGLLGSWAFVRKAYDPTIHPIRPAAPKPQRRLLDPACPVAPADGSGSNFSDAIESNSLQSKTKAFESMMIAHCGEP
jgi:hypothetical protein